MPVNQKSLSAIDAESPFGQASGADCARAQLLIAKAALDFLESGLKDFTGRGQLVRLETFSAQLKCVLLDAAAYGVALPPKQSDTAASGARAMSAFHLAFMEHTDYLFGALAAPWIGGCSEKDEAASALSVLGASPLELPKHKDPLQLAYLMSRFNVTRAEQRIAVLHLLGGVLRGRGSTLQPASQAEFDAVSAYLWGARQHHLVRLLAMGTLLGGQALEDNKALVKGMYGEGKSVMELLEVDCVHPGRYLSASEDKFRKAMDKA